MTLAAFLTKAQYLEEFAKQRAGTLAILDQFTEAQLAEPSPAPIQKFAATVGAMFANQANHWLMHAGQWVIVRRQLGKPALF